MNIEICYCKGIHLIIVSLLCDCEDISIGYVWRLFYMRGVVVDETFKSYCNIYYNVM